MSEWQPMESAPQDGTKFLVWQSGGGTYEIAIAWFDERDPDVWQVQNLPLLGVRRDHLWTSRYWNVLWMPFPLPEPPALLDALKEET